MDTEAVDPLARSARARASQRDLAIALIGLASLLAWDASGLDLPLIRQFGDAHGFAWREQWFTARVMHEGGRWISVALFGLTLAACLRPFGPWRGLATTERVWWLGITVVCLVTIPLLKKYSHTSCPWDLQEFGGVAHYVSHWDLGLGGAPAGDGGPGRCFPSGHASGAFSFLAIGFALRRLQPQRARQWTLWLCGLGLAFGIAQMARGAHYLSHTLYTAWVCWGLTALSWSLLPRLEPSAPSLEPATSSFGP